MKILLPILPACALALGVTSCAHDGQSGKLVYAGPALGVSVGYGGVQVGLTLYGRTPSPAPTTQPPTPVATK